MNHENVRIGKLPTGKHKKFADLRLRNEPKNLRICDLLVNVHLCYQLLSDNFGSSQITNLPSHGICMILYASVLRTD
jgi:hypothetical protein